MPSIARALFWVTEKEKRILEKKWARLLIMTNLISLFLFLLGKARKDYTKKAVLWAYLVVKLTVIARILAVIVFLISYLLITLR